MKKKLLLVIFALVCVSCSHSLEEKANALIEVDLKKSLYHPETYNPAETVVDSAFTPFDDPIFYEKTITLCKLGVEIEDYERKIKDEKSDMAFHKDMLQIMYSNSEKESYNQAKNDESDVVLGPIFSAEVSKISALGNVIVTVVSETVTFSELNFSKSIPARTSA